MRPPLRLFPLALLLAGCGPKATPDAAADADIAGPPLASELPFDAGVRTGTLDNGLRWFIEENAVPDDRVVLRLVVETGSVLEDEDQLGLAHFVEHMAFNGTQNFPGNSLITTLEGLGSRFGPHINAHTSFDETVYKLQLPTDDPEIVDTGFRILGDWAGGLTFDAEEIEKERGVVLEEWRQRLGAGKRIGDQLRPLTFHDSVYDDRLPIGTEESLTGFEHEALKRFYDDWYRPDLMSVIVVGDIEPDAIQAKIEATFGGLEGPKEPRERVRPDIPAHEQILAKVVTDAEVPVANVSLSFKHDDIERNTHAAYRESLVSQLAITMLNMRYAELSQAPDAPFLGAGMGQQRLTPTEGLLAVGAGCRGEQVPDALRAAWTEVVRAERHGFTEPELERARKAVLTGYERYLAEEETTASVTHAEELIRHVTTGEPVPGIRYEVELARTWLPGITADEVGAWMAQAITHDSRVLTSVVPDKPGLTPPTAEELVAILAEVEASDIPPPAAEAELGDPVQEIPEAGTVIDTDTTYADDLGFTGWTLSNGVKVWFRKTDFKQDQVLFRGFRPGGHRGLSDDDYLVTRMAVDVKGASGAGALSQAELMKWMAGRSLSVSFYVDDDSEDVTGSASPRDLGDALALVWQGFTDPRLTEEGRAQVLKGQRAALENRDQQPAAKMAKQMAETVWPDSPRVHPWTLEQVEGALSDMDALASRFDAHFGDASGFTFVFVGNLPDDFEDHVKTWLGALPTDPDARPTAADGVELVRKPGPHEVVVNVNTADKASVGLTWYAPFEDQTWETRNRLTAVDEVLSTRLREELREERGGVYGVSVSSRAISEWPADEARISVSFTCDPERVDELREAALAVVDEVRTQPVAQRYIDEIQAKRARSREESLQSNGFWSGSFAGALERGEDPMKILTYDERNASLTPQVVLQAAQRFLPDTAPEVVGVRLPAEDAQGAESAE